MAQNHPQFQRPLLRIGSIAFLAGMIITVASTAIHPSTEDPANHHLVFAEYANDETWVAVHIGQFAGVIMIFARGICDSLPHTCAIRIKHGFYTSVD